MHKKIKRIVNDLIEKYETRNVYELCKCLDIKIFYHELGNIKGLYQKEGNCYMIHLNNNLNPFDEIVVLAHELGHAILHKRTNVCFLKRFTYLETNKYELQANFFAVELLIDDNDFINFIKENEYATVYNASQHFKVPTELILYKFDNNINNSI